MCQCGADSLYGDTCDTQNPFNLTTYSYGKCIKMLIDLDIPTIFLGGGKIKVIYCENNISI